ncbi:Patatin-like phospholipase [Rhodospirillales bacterium URHD0017]|nr:Patatin-like phospholipase [Rhodospirillales bacterium URHD0017]
MTDNKADSTANKNVYDIGLAMAGAISAGAYSAGVIDFLFQALHEWQLVKDDDREKKSVPNHSVCIRAAAGASAGSITAALAAVAVSGGLRPEKVEKLEKGQQPYRYVLPALHRAWVTLPDMARGPGTDDLLTNDDMENGASPQSILNAAILDTLTEEALKLPAVPEGALAGPAQGGDPLPYVAKRLHLYLTLSNMRGVPYFVGFEGSGNERGHHMMCHGDRVHYVLDGIGTHDGENRWLADDDHDVLKIKTVPGGKAADERSAKCWKAYGQTALASAAFPVGLAARHVQSNVSKYVKRKWPHLSAADDHEPPNWPETWDKADQAYNFMSIDGGLIDNEPFEYARRAIMRDNDANKSGESSVKGAVLMIDPFPEAPAFSLKEVTEASVFDVARAMFPMLKNQARFKPETLATAFDNSNYSRWMIAPSRPVEGSPTKKNERYSIATGVLGGFGGFLDEAFRAHDYQLGRRNCQKFLRDIFSVGEGHPFVEAWPHGVARDYCYLDEATWKVYFPVIPLVGTAALEVPAPKWPRICEERLAEIERRIRERANYVVAGLVRGWTKSPTLNVLARKLWRWNAEQPLMMFVHRTIETDLSRRDQLETGSSYSADAREVLAEMKSRGRCYRTLDGLDEALDLNKSQILRALEELEEKTPTLLWSGLVDNKQCWMLSVRRPAWWMRNGPFKHPPRIG